MTSTIDYTTSGTNASGKYYRSDTRWAKVMVTKLTYKPAIITCAYGVNGEFRAFDISDEYTLQKDAKASAITWVTRGSVVY